MNLRNAEARKPAVDWDALREKTRIGIEHAATESELDAIFAQRATALSRNIGSAEADATGQGHLAFVDGGMTFSVELESVLRVLGGRRLSQIPGAPRHLDSVFYESGRIVSAVRLSVLFTDAGTEAPEPADERIVLLDASGVWLGLRATRVLGMRVVKTSELGKPSPSLAHGLGTCVRGIAEDLIVVLDGTALAERLRQK